MKHLIYFIPILLFIGGCTEDPKEDIVEDPIIEIPVAVEEYGFILDQFNVVRDTIRSGDTFGGILDANGVSNSKIFEVATTFKDSFDVRRIRMGKPFVLLNSKDTINTTQVFIYEYNKVDYAVVDLRDSIQVYNRKKPVKFIEKEASGVITSSLSQTMDENNISQLMTYKLENIYAWTVNFFHLQEGDNFKVIYTEKFLNDTISAGIDEIKAAYFEHRGKSLYAFNFTTPVDSTIVQSDYYDEQANNLRRAFLKSPVKLSYISSKYNLRRRIAHYGYRVKPHKGTDFAASYGAPILATADGVVTKSERRGGNGNYVKIRHNTTYETQYLHMSRRKSRVGEYVKQGDVIGYVGSTGSSSGNHVCYRFWKNGKQVDPFKQDLPASKPLDSTYHEAYFNTISPVKEQLDCISY